VRSVADVCVAVVHHATARAIIYPPPTNLPTQQALTASFFFFFFFFLSFLAVLCDPFVGRHITATLPNSMTFHQQAAIFDLSPR
jgi:hypothetical protein